MISVTSLSTYIYCPRMLYLQSVIEFEEAPKEAMVRGSIKHETIELVNKNEKQIVTGILPSFKEEDIEMAYRKAYYNFLMGAVKRRKKQINELGIDRMELFKGAWRILFREAKTRAGNVSKFIEQSKLYGEELWEGLEPKYLSEVRIMAPMLGLVGIVDKIETYPGRFVPIEMKSGNMPSNGTWPGHRIQIAAYMLMLREVRKLDMKEGFVEYIDYGEKRPVVLNPFLEDEIKALVVKVMS
jgi:CRISPR-associated exonuclease Cas4